MRNVLLGCVRAEVVYRLFARATPPPAVGFGNMTKERVTVTAGQQLDLPACELDLVAKNGLPKFVTCN